MRSWQIFIRQHLMTNMVNFSFISIFSLMYLLSATAFADNLIHFDIKQQRADKALIVFAKATNRTIIFPFDLTKKYQANKLMGYYSAIFALDKLLKNTGLTATTNDSGQITVQLQSKKIASEAQGIKEQFQLAPPTKTVRPNSLEKITVIGSRVSGRSANDLPVPVDILTSAALTNTGQTEVGRMLQTITPSFNFSSSAISDGTDAFRPATLRGLGPDQTLVLLNGKRRHQASLIHINSSVGRGTTGTDMNAIPAAAIKRIEVLRDGAAAQYGSDAIAGIINIVLNDSDEYGAIAVSYGEYSQGDGETTNVNISKGLALGENGYINSTFNFRDRGYTNRAGLHGTCQFDGCIETDNGEFIAVDPRELTISRDTFRVGDANSQQVALVVNSKYQLSQGELYGFLTLSSRENESATFFRQHNSINNPMLADGDTTIEDGFLPKINADIKDISYSLGYQINFDNDATFDISYSYGKNTIDYQTSDSLNASYANALQYQSDELTSEQIRQDVPRQAYAYGLALTLQTINLDFTHQFDDFLLALGSELRQDNYQVKAGEQYSYFDYDSQNGESLFASDYNSGIQGFTGIAGISALNESRDVISFYADIESRLNESFSINTAIRYDNYQGFGDNTNIKLAAKWLLNEKISVRGAISTGFRAPSMQQLYFNNISTQFIANFDEPTGDQIPIQVGTFRNDSALANNIGIPELKEENAVNISLGSVIQLTPQLNLTIDFYQIDIDDRIVISDQLTEGLSPTLDEILAVSGAGAAQFFLNGADTQTSGIDIIATWQTYLMTGVLNFTFAANFTQTEVTHLFTPSDSNLEDIPPEKIFSTQEISIIEQWQPQDRISLSALYQINDLTLNLALNRYGEYKIIDGGEQTYGAKTLTDLRINYQLNEQLSFNIGGNNLFDVYPDKNTIGNSRSGTILDSNGNVIVDSAGIFTYSRRSAPFGFNGAYYYAGLEYQF